MPVDPSTTETAPTGAVSSDANPAISSGAENGNAEAGAKPQTVFEAVQEQLKKDGLIDDSPKSKEGDAEAAEGDPETDPKAKAEGEGDGESEEEQPPFHKHPAWQKQLQQKRELTEQVDQLKPKAERFDAMVGMMQQANLSTEEVDAGFNIMALMKGDPQKALEAIQPYYRALLEVTGNALPDDIRQRVDEGRMTDEDARELARTRAQANGLRQSSEAAQRQRAEEAAAATGRDMQLGVSEWETAWQAKDPDYPKKLDFVATEIRALKAEKPPRNRAEAVALAEQALKNVNARMRGLLPRQPGTKPAPTSETTARTVQAPRSALEAANLALANMGA